MIAYTDSGRYIEPTNVGDLLLYLKEHKPCIVPIKTVFYKGKKLCNLNNGSFDKNINKLSDLPKTTKVRFKYKKSRRTVGDYQYFNNRMRYLVAYID